MKHLGQIAIIAGVSLVGELLSFLIPLPVPGSIYGLLLMLLLLVTKLIKLRQVKTVANWLISLMPVTKSSTIIIMQEIISGFSSELISLLCSTMAMM